MKRLFVILIFSHFSLCLFSQTKNISDNIYSNALEKLIEHLDSTDHIKDATFSFLYTVGVTEFLPHLYLNHEILIQSEVEQQALLRKNKTVYLFLISPMRFKDNDFIIGFSSYSYSQQMKSINGTWECHFRFDCEKSQFIFLNIKGGGS
jgi:hypothetical protein